LIISADQHSQTANKPVNRSAASPNITFGINVPRCIHRKRRFPIASSRAMRIQHDRTDMDAHRSRCITYALCNIMDPDSPDVCSAEVSADLTRRYRRGRFSIRDVRVNVTATLRIAVIRRTRGIFPQVKRSRESPVLDRDREIDRTSLLIDVHISCALSSRSWPRHGSRPRRCNPRLNFHLTRIRS